MAHWYSYRKRGGHIVGVHLSDPQHPVGAEEQVAAVEDPALSPELAAAREAGRDAWETKHREIHPEWSDALIAAHRADKTVDLGGGDVVYDAGTSTLRRATAREAADKAGHEADDLHNERVRKAKETRQSETSARDIHDRAAVEKFYEILVALGAKVGLPIPALDDILADVDAKIDSKKRP